MRLISKIVRMKKKRNKKKHFSKIIFKYSFTKFNHYFRPSLDEVKKIINMETKFIVRQRVDYPDNVDKYLNEFFFVCLLFVKA